MASVDLNRLLATLNTSGLQLKDQPLYQVISNLIKFNQQNQNFNIETINTIFPAGVLPVSSGGTGSSIFTAGSVIFATGVGPTLKLTEDNANFFWDDTNNRLGIGNNAPGFPLEVTGIIKSTSLLVTSVVGAALDHTTRGQLDFQADGSLRLFNEAGTIFTTWNINEISWGTDNAIVRNGAGIFLFTNAAQTIGFTVNAGTADLFIVRNRANSANAGIEVGSLQADSVINDTGLAHGVYTPTLTNVANLDASTSFQAQYLRVGNTITVSGKVEVDPTAPAAATQLGISLPVASNIGAQEDLGGTAFAPLIAGQGAAIYGDAANNRAQMEWVAGDITNQVMTFIFTYRVI